METNIKPRQGGDLRPLFEWEKKTLKQHAVELAEWCKDHYKPPQSEGEFSTPQFTTRKKEDGTIFVKSGKRTWVIPPGQGCNGYWENSPEKSILPRKNEGL